MRVHLTDTTVDLAGATIGRFDARDAVFDGVRISLRNVTFRRPEALVAADPGVDLTAADLRGGTVVDLSDITAAECELVLDRIDQGVGSTIVLDRSHLTDCRLSFRGLHQAGGATLSFRSVRVLESNLTQRLDFGAWVPAAVDPRIVRREVPRHHDAHSTEVSGRIDFGGATIGGSVDWASADVTGAEMIDAPGAAASGPFGGEAGPVGAVAVEPTSTATTSMALPVPVRPVPGVVHVPAARRSTRRRTGGRARRSCRGGGPRVVGCRGREGRTAHG